MKRSYTSTIILATTLALTLGLSGLVTNADALTIRVAQESSVGAGDYDSNVLGFITSFSTTETMKDFYNYAGTSGASYGGEAFGGPDGVSDLSQVFLVSASDGVSLNVVHDAHSFVSTDGGGTATTRWDLSGDTSAVVQSDDPGEPVSVSMGGTRFDSTNGWGNCCTDGYAIGELDGNWEMIGAFWSTPTGLDAGWRATSGDGAHIDLTLLSELHVQLKAVADPIPEPASMILFGSGLVGLAAWRRFKKNA